MFEVIIGSIRWIEQRIVRHISSMIITPWLIEGDLLQVIIASVIVVGVHLAGQDPTAVEVGHGECIVRG